MTIPKGTEQWECDLIAPSAAPGLTDERANELICEAMDQPWAASEDDWSVDDIRSAVKHAYATGYAAGQAHPQGPPREPTRPLWQHADGGLYTVLTLGAKFKLVGFNEWQDGYVVYRSEDDAQIYVTSAARWAKRFTRIPDAAPAASQAAPGSVAEPMLWRNPAPDAAPSSMPSPMQEMTIGMRPDGRRLLNDAPAKAQEPDALVQRLRGIATYRCQADREICGEAADRIEQLQAQAVADAAALRGLQADQLVTLRMKQTAEAARDTAMALLREVPRNRANGYLVKRIDDFLASSGQASGEGAK